VGDFSWSFYVTQILAGLSLGVFLFLIASGLSLILGVMGIVNFAHGSLYMIGAYLTWYVVASLGGGFWLGIVAAAVVVAILGMVLQRFLLSRLYGKTELQLLFTFALVLIFSDVVKIVFGVMPKGVPYPTLLVGVVQLGSIQFPLYHLFVIILGPVLAILLHLAERRTRIGRIVRATSLNREMVSSLGINTEKVFMLVFAFGAFLSGLGGALVSPTTSIAPGMDVPVVLPAFVAVVVGGLGSFSGTLFACLIIGLVQAFGILILPQLSESFIFLLMALILIFRPWGLSNIPPKV